MATKHPTTHLSFLANPHSGRDEMNLAGHPFALLQSPKRQSETSIFYDWERTLADGRVVTASWRVETPAAFGLPGPEEELVYLVLLQLTREAAEAAGTPRQWPLVVNFSRGKLLRRLGWSDSSEKYTALKLAFRRLKAVSITARHAFYDARTKTPASEIGFGILNEYSLVDEPKGCKSRGNLPLSHFEWNTILHTSFLAGNVRSLNLDFLISLQHPTSRRLFRLLEVLRYSNKPPRPQVSIGLWKLRDRLGMTPYPFPSKVSEKLAPAVEELTKCGYIAGLSVEKDKSGAPVAHFRFGDVARAMTSSEPQTTPQSAPQTVESPPAQSAQSAQRTLKIPDMGPRSIEEQLMEGEAARHRAIDAVWDTLDEATRADVEQCALEQLAPFARANLRRVGAQGDLRRARRHEVEARFPDLVESVPGESVSSESVPSESAQTAPFR